MRQQKKWTEAMIQTLREGYADRLNRDIAAELGVPLRAVEWWAHRLGLKKPPGFLEAHKKEIYGKRRPAHHKGQFTKGWKLGHRFAKGWAESETEEHRRERIRKSTEARRRQTYDELLRIKYGLRRKTRLPLPDKVYYIDKSKYFKEDE